MNSISKWLVVLAISMIGAGCVAPIRYEGTYQGRVVDEETREPIEGAVILATWHRHHDNLAGGYHTFYDARETVTDKKGEFEMPGMGLLLFSNIEKMEMMAYKAGYGYRNGSWESFKTGISGRKYIKWEGDKAIVPIRKLTVEERRLQMVPSPPDDAKKEKIQLMIDEINKDRVATGFEPIKIGR